MASKERGEREREGDRQAGRQAIRHAGMHACRQAGIQSPRQQDILSLVKGRRWIVL